MKVMVLGLDGATWTVLKPLSNFGFLPNIKKFMHQGCVGILKSTIPPVTSPAWPCLATGMNPGKIGAFSTLMRYRKDDFRLKPVNSSLYRGKSFWDILSYHGYRVALVKIPFLYPVYEINGYMISGFGGSGKLAVYPRNLHRKVMEGPSKVLEMKLFDRLTKLDVNNLSEVSSFLEGVKKLIQEEGKVVQDLVQNLSWDLFFYVLSAIDWIQHVFMDKILEIITKFETKELSSIDETGRRILELYNLVDHIVGRLAKVIMEDKECVFFMVSDHGFTVRPFTFNIAKWLVDNGYMKLRGIYHAERSSLSRQVVDLLKKLPTESLQKILPAKILKLAEKLFVRMSSEAALEISQQIDFGNSIAFCLEDSGIYINPLIDDETVLEELVNQLKNFLENNYGLKLVTFKRKEIYRGDKIELAPDLIIEIRDRTFIWEKSTDPNKPLIFKPKLSGIHDYDGIFLACGPEIKEGCALRKPLKIYDIAPTVLHIFRCPIPTNMDGRVVKEIFKENSVYAKSPIVKESEKEFIRRVMKHRLLKLKLEHKRKVSMRTP